MLAKIIAALLVGITAVYPVESKTDELPAGYHNLVEEKVYVWPCCRRGCPSHRQHTECLHRLFANRLTRRHKVWQKLIGGISTDKRNSVKHEILATTAELLEFRSTEQSGLHRIQVYVDQTVKADNLYIRRVAYDTWYRCWRRPVFDV